MQIVIDIDDNLYTRLFDNSEINAVDMLKVCVAVRKGVVIPKGHGRLIDASNLLTVTDYDGENEKTYVLYDEIDNAPVIIKADKAESEG